jgi:hypothetical protein
VSKDDKEAKHECVYVGPHEDTRMQLAGKSPAPPTNEYAREVALSILDGSRGKYRSRDHFQKRMKEREFDVFEVAYVIRNGKCVEDGHYCDEQKNFEYTFGGDIDGVGFEATFALSAEHDLIKSPLLILVSGVWKTKTGKRRKRF